VSSLERDVVAIINTSVDTVDLLKDVLEQAGFLVVSTFTTTVKTGGIDLEAFLRTHRPKVILYDIAPPYDRNWEFFQHLRSTALAGYRFVLTTVNRQHVERLAGRDEEIYEVVGRQDDLDVIVRATREALRARPTR